MSITKKEKRIRSDGSGKGKKNVHSYSIKLFIFGKFEKCSTRYEKEWGFSFVYSDKNKLEGNAVVMDVGLS